MNRHGENICKNQAFPRGLPFLFPWKVKVMHKTFLSLKFLKSVLNWKKASLWELHVMTLLGLSAVKCLSLVCFHLPACFSCDSDCGSVNAASDKKQGQ